MTYFTIQEVAQRHRVKPITIYRRVNSGKMFAKKVGQKWLIPEYAILNFENGENHGPQE